MPMIRMRLRHWWCIYLACTPLAVHADAIIPYMVVPWGQVFLLPIVILVEGFILRSMLGGNFRSNLFQSLVANVASTILGAALYLATMPLVEESLFTWWFKGGFSAKAVRNACIALAFACVLWAISWVSETLVIARMRKANSIKEIAFPCAIANLSTYALLLALAILFGREHTHEIGKDEVDFTRNSTNIESLLRPHKNFPYVGFWKSKCTDDFGLAIEAGADGKYTVAFCGPGGCDGRKNLEHTSITDDPHYRIIDQNTIAVTSLSGADDIRYRCAPIK